MRGVLCFWRACDQFCHAVHRRLQNVANQVCDALIARGLSIKIDNERRNHLRRVFATMRGEQNLKRLKQRRRLLRALQDLMNFLFMPIGHCGNNGILVLKIAINEANADPGFGANVVHAGLVEASLSEADQGRIKNLGASIRAGVCLGLWHKTRKMNERSFIVKSHLSAPPEVFSNPSSLPCFGSSGGSPLASAGG